MKAHQGHSARGDSAQPKFQNTQEYVFRRNCRDSIRKSCLTRTEKDIAIAFLNHWFYHRHEGVVYPGRKKIAKRTRASVKTVSRTFALLRACGVIKATAFLHGKQGNATEYVIDLQALFSIPRIEKEALQRLRSKINPPLKTASGVNGGTKVPGCGRDKKSHRSNDGKIIPFPRNGS